MALMSQEVDAILKRYEAIAADRAIFEDGELAGYEDEIEDELVECYAEFVALTDLMIPSLRSGKVKYEDLHEVLRVKTLSEFSTLITQQGDAYPMLDGFFEDLQGWEWAPLHESLRKVFTVDIVKAITTKLEFDLVWRGYCETLELYSIYTQLIDEAVDAINVITHLQSLGMADPLQKEQMSVVLGLLHRIAEDYVPPKRSEFQDSSAGLEDVISAWINEVTTTLQEPLNDDILDLIHEDVDPVIVDLKGAWFKINFELEAVVDNKFWQLSDSNIETGFRTERKFLGKKKNKIYIHTLYQLQEIVVGQSGESFNRPLDKWKICLLRTGFRHEYLPNEGNGLIAAQLLTASKVLESSLDNFSAEVNWLRLGERETVLEGISRVEAEALAVGFFENS